MAAVSAETALARVCDLAGRPRGTAFTADDHGTLVTSHEAVDGLSRVVVHAAHGRTCLVEAEHITPLPDGNLALVRTSGLDLPPLVIGADRTPPEGTPVRLWDGHWLEARIAGTASAIYTSTERYHPLDGVLVLEFPEAVAAQLRLSRRASGTPVLDAATGSVLAVLGTALHAPRGRRSAFAVPPHTAGRLPHRDGAVARLLRRNGATVPGFGPDLNLAGVLQLTTVPVRTPPRGGGRLVARPEIAEELRRFGASEALVTALVGAPGTGRTTELAAYADRRVQGVAPAPTIWLRGAELREGDDSVRAAVARMLSGAGRVVLAQAGACVGTGMAVGGPPVGHAWAAPAADAPGSGDPSSVQGGIAPEAGFCRWGDLPTVGDPREVDPDSVARLARQAGRALLVVLDAPEEMPPPLARELCRWTTGTSGWLRATGARLALACRPEFWEQAAVNFPAGTLYLPGGEAAVGGAARQPTVRGTGGASPPPCEPSPPPCVRVGDLTPEQAARARERHGLSDGAVAWADAAHPLALRMLAEVKRAQRDVPMADATTEQDEAANADAATRKAAPDPEDGPVAAHAPGRPEIFSAYLDLVALRVALRLAAADRPSPPCGAVRRLAARVAGQLHEAARHCLGPGQGQLDRMTFEQIFPGGGGWCEAVLAEGVFAPAGDGYRFEDEEFADWFQGTHLQLDTALAALVHHSGDGSGSDEAGHAPVPRHRIGPVVQALLLCADREGPDALARRLNQLVAALRAAVPPAPSEATSAQAERGWWAARLLGVTLPRVPDAEPYADVLRALAEHIVAVGGSPGFGPPFWLSLSLSIPARLELLRRLLPADPPPGGAVGGRGRYLDAVGELLVAAPHTVQPLLCSWFDDVRALRGDRTPPSVGPVRSGGAGAVGGPPTVADAAQALLYTHRAPDAAVLLETLADATHPRAGELLAELAHDEPSALCRAVARWARDPRAERRRTAAVYGLRTARYATADADRDRLRTTALALLSRPGDHALHGHALALLVRDPARRARHLDEALAHFTWSGSPELASALGTALATHPEPVLAAFRVRLRQPGAVAREGLRVLAEASGTGPVLRAAGLVREYAELEPQATGEAVATFVRRRLSAGTAEHSVLRPLVDELLRARPASVRVPLAGVLGAAEGRPGEELRAALLAGESEPVVLDAVLDAFVRHGGLRHGAEQVRHLALLMGRTAEGAALFGQRLIALSRHLPEFATRLHSWTQADPEAWAALVGPSAPHTCAAPTESPGA
ncbi:serine protease [Streptomyces sp. N2-109]|uniref:Serine protease n=1 Tax=Streptomyces gossypii TaxID=2883101 RepID=A0ABT2K3U3_9ACTN|nr:serine protease [Streptomyces gossypii]MCT2594831.1 serine protease [Streptomyces gossypii]